MAKRKSGFANFKAVGLFGGLAAALAGGGYYVGKNGAPPLPQGAASLLDKAGVAHEQKAAPAEVKSEARSDKPAESGFLTKLVSAAAELKAGPSKPQSAKSARSKPAKSDSAKADSAKSESAKSDSAKSENAKADAAKARNAKTQIAKAKVETARKEAGRRDLARADARAPETAGAASKESAAPIPPALIAETPKAEAAKTDAPKPERQKMAMLKAEGPSADDVTNTTPGADAPLTASLLGKGIPTSEDSNIRLSVNFENRSGRPIRAFEGVLKFTDKQNNRLFSSKVSVSALISDHGKMQWDERVDPDKLDAKGKKLVDSDKDSLNAVFEVRKVFFVDGSVQKFGARS